MGEIDVSRDSLQSFGSNQMRTADPFTAEIWRFLVGPAGRSVSNGTTAPDGRAPFIKVQHRWGKNEHKGFWWGHVHQQTVGRAGPDRVPHSAIVVISAGCSLGELLVASHLAVSMSLYCRRHVVFRLPSDVSVQ